MLVPKESDHCRAVELELLMIVFTRLGCGSWVTLKWKFTHRLMGNICRKLARQPLPLFSSAPLFARTNTSDLLKTKWLLWLQPRHRCPESTDRSVRSDLTDANWCYAAVVLRQSLCLRIRGCGRPLANPSPPALMD